MQSEKKPETKGKQQEKQKQGKQPQQKQPEKEQAPEIIESEEALMSFENRLVEERIKKLKEIEGSKITAYPYSFEHKNHSAELKEKYKTLEADKQTQDMVSVAGRIMTIRNMGKASFFNIQDSTGKMQLYIREDSVGKDKYSLFKKLDMGDFIGAKGAIVTTRTGELTVNISDFELLCKSIRPLPEKYHGLKNTEIKYRQRYLDLIMNEDTRKVFLTRTRIISAIREFLNSRGFNEFETPVLQPIYGGAKAKPFITTHNTLKMKLYLRISNELYLKRLLVGGFEKVYEIVKDFRNEGIDTTHNPEFTMIEIYQAYVDYNAMMKLCEEIYEFVCMKVLGTTKLNYQGNIIDFKAPWDRIPMADAIKKYANIDLAKYDYNELKDFVRTYNLEIQGDLTRGKIIEALFEELVEDKLIQPTFITDFPKESTPLCKLHRKNPELIERFEPYVNGWEIGNAYSELNDPLEQRRLLEQQASELRGGAEEAHPMDDDFIRALEYGMPPAGGLGMGIDRMVMLLTDQPCIRDVILFPTMKDSKESEPKDIKHVDNYKNESK